MRERNKTTDEDGEVEGRDYEWIELPSFDNPNEKIRMKRYYDMAQSETLGDCVKILIFAS